MTKRSGSSSVRLDQHLLLGGAAREEDVARRRDRDLEPEEVDDGDDDRLEEREPGEQPHPRRGEQAADADAEERRQQDEVREIRQQPDVRRHPADQRDLQEQDEERREEDAERALESADITAGRPGDPELLQRLVRTALPLGDDMLPMYCRSSTPILLEQNPLAVRSRKLLKKATPCANSGFALLRPGDVVEDGARAPARCRRGTACRSAAGTRGRSRPGRRASRSAASGWSTIMKSMNSGTPASVALPERSSFGMMRSTSTRTVAYSCAVKNFGLNAGRRAARPARRLRRPGRAPAPPRRRST